MSTVCTPAGQCYTKESDVSHAAWTLGATERINRLRDQYWHFVPTLDTERALAYTQVYRQTEAEDTILRRAKAFHHYYSTKTISINPHELIVGTLGRAPRSVVFCPEISWRWIRDELDTMATRPQDPYQVSEEDKRLLRQEIFPYWEGKSLDEYFTANLPADLMPMILESGAVFLDFKSTCGAGDHAPGFETLLKKGFKGIQDDAKAYLAQIDPYDEHFHDKRRFYEAVILTCDAMKVLGERHAAKALELASVEKDPERQAELLRIAAICARVPYYPAQTFREALQAVWFIELSMYVEENATSIGLGRLDQYLYPYYQRDLENGALTQAQAQELLECLWIKLAETVYVVSKANAAFYSGYQPYVGLTLGGCDQNGQDASNELSFMMLQATMDLQMHVPTTYVRMCADSPEPFVRKVCDLVALGTGQPAIFFDETSRKVLEKDGIPADKTWNIAFTGCIEPSLPGEVSMWNEGGRFNFASAVEWALFNGVSKRLGKRFGLETGDARTFDTYEKFEHAVQAQLKYMLKLSCLGCGVAERAHLLRAPTPLRSITTAGCLEKGADIMTGSARYNIGPGIESTGIADLADSMAAVKKLVYDEKIISMAQLLEALEHDFDGYENLRQALIQDAPKYGNDDPYVDQIADQFNDIANQVCESYTSLWGTPYIHGVVPVMANVAHGAVVGALPSGRKSGTPLADGASPYPSYDKNGPSAIIKSVASLHNANNGCGTLLNMKFSPALLKSGEDKTKLGAMLRAMARLGCYHVQFNVVGRDTLEDAVEHPQDHQDLLVRVAGYSAYFTQLRPESQQMIIDRTELSAW